MSIYIAQTVGNYDGDWKGSNGSIFTCGPQRLKYNNRSSNEANIK